jgi:type II secretion system protein J
MADPPGFTLLEVLVAVAVSATLLMTLLTAFNTFLISAQEVEQDIDLIERLQPGLRVMTADLEQVFVLQPPRYHPPEFNDDPDPYRFQADETAVDGRVFSRLGFASVNHLISGEHPVYGVSRIDYYVYRHGERYDLHRSDRVYPVDRDIDPCRDPVLFKDIQTFSLTFSGENGEDYREWNSDSKDYDSSVPFRVTIRVETGTDDPEEMVIGSVILPVSRLVSQ